MTLFATWRASGEPVEIEGESLEELAAQLPEDYDGPAIPAWDAQGFLRGWIKGRGDWRSN